MNTYKISTINKKSIEEVQIWRNNQHREFRITIGWRWGSVFAKLNLQTAKNLDENWSADMFNEFSAELDYLDDSWYESIDFESFSEDEKNYISNLWYENTYEGLESDGWYQSETELWFFGPCEVELVDE